MEQHQNRRLAAEILTADREALIAIQALTDYRPINRAYDAATLAQLGVAMEQAQQAHIIAQHALVAARNAALAAEWALHDAIQGAKAQVRAQYGDDSSAIRAVGLKKKSERKRPVRRKQAVAE